MNKTMKGKQRASTPQSSTVDSTVREVRSEVDTHDAESGGQTPTAAQGVIFNPESPDGPSSAGWHKIQSFLECPKKYQFSQVRGIYAPTAETPDYFAIGQLFHVAKAHWFARHFADDEGTRAAIRTRVAKAADKAKLPISAKAQQQALRYFEEYVHHWKMRPKPKVLAAEYDIGPAPIAPHLTGTQATWRTARLDDVSYYEESGGRLAIGESKTTSGSINDCINEYTLHGQPMLQLLLWKTAPQGEAMHGPVSGVVLDVIKKGYSEPSKFSRVWLPINNDALAWYAKTLHHAVLHAASMHWDNDVPRNITSCTRMAGRARVACEFRELCMHGRSAAVRYLLPGGKSLSKWVPDEDHTVPPWK